MNGTTDWTDPATRQVSPDGGAVAQPSSPAPGIERYAKQLYSLRMDLPRAENIETEVTGVPGDQVPHEMSRLVEQAMATLDLNEAPALFEIRWTGGREVNGCPSS